MILSIIVNLRNKIQNWRTGNPADFSFLQYASIIILFVHFILATYGIDVINIEGYQQLMHEPEASTHFWRYVWYMHGNPPGLSIIFAVCKWFGSGSAVRGLTVVLPLMYVASLYAFYFGSKKLNLRLPNLFFFLVFLNPLLFIYFKFPFYCTFIFFNACCLIYLFSKFKRLDMAGLAALIGIICFNSLTRSTWHIAFVVALVCAILVKSQVKGRWWLTPLVLFPLGLYAKNYYLYSEFASSSWLGSSLASTHIPWKAAKPGTLGYLHPNGLVDMYKGRYNENDPRILKYRNVPEINKGDWQDIRFLVISEDYLRETKFYFNWQWSANAVLAGALLAMQSPADYFLLKKEHGGPKLKDRPIFNYDWFCPVEFRYRSPYFFSFIDLPEMYHAYKPWDWLMFITPYTVIWLGLLTFFGIRFFRMPFEYRVFYLITTLSLGIFIVVDNAESLRMRYEVEPFLYLFAGVAIARIRNGHWAWDEPKEKSIATPLG